MLFRIFGLLVDGDVEVGDANGPGALDLRDLVALRHRDERASKLQPMRSIRVVGKAFWVLLVIPVGAVEDRHDIPIRLCPFPRLRRCGGDGRLASFRVPGCYVRLRLRI